jgi:hypothetical protein
MGLAGEIEFTRAEMVRIIAAGAAARGLAWMDRRLTPDQHEARGQVRMKVQIRAERLAEARRVTMAALTPR